ncbi:hypothetical protein ACJJTC_009060 [Scirpophaga incertulas]
MLEKVMHKNLIVFLDLDEFSPPSRRFKLEGWVAIASLKQSHRADDATVTYQEMPRRDAQRFPSEGRKRDDGNIKIQRKKSRLHLSIANNDAEQGFVGRWTIHPEKNIPRTDGTTTGVAKQIICSWERRLAKRQTLHVRAVITRYEDAGIEHRESIL